MVVNIFMNVLTYFHCPPMFLMKVLGTPYQVAVLLVGGPSTGCGPRCVAVWITGIVVR